MGFFPSHTRLGKIENKIERSKRAASERASREYQERKREEELTMSRHRRCDHRCINAQPGSPCSCQCGGQNHAGGWVQDPTTGRLERARPPRRTWTGGPTPTRHPHTEDVDQLQLTLA